MNLRKEIIGTELPKSVLTVDSARLRFFAKSIGEINPLYVDSDYAQRFGHTDLPVPPTFLFSIELEGPDPFKWVAELGVDLRHILHGEQSFVYHSVAHAGDTLVAAPYISDVYEKGSLGFLVKETKVARENGSEVADLRTVIVVRGGEGK